MMYPEKTLKVEARLLRMTLFGFKLICLSLTVYMSCTQFLRYLDNNDKASVSFRQFNHSPRDRYPTYTICFENQKRRMNLFNKTYLNLYGINRSHYYNMIRGVYIDEVSLKSSIIADIDFERATTNPKEIVSGYFVRYNKGPHRKVNAEAIKNLRVNSDLSWVNPIEAEYLKSLYNTTFNISKQFPFYKNYQDFDRICLVRNHTYRKGMVRSFERFVMWTRRINNFDRAISNTQPRSDLPRIDRY